MTGTKNPYLLRMARTANLTNSHKRAPKQEKELAKRVGGQVTPASGSRELKGDVRVKRVVRIEAKTTKHKSFNVTWDMLEKLELAAMVSDEVPVLIVEFNENGKKIKEVAIVPSYILEAIYGR